MLEKTLESPLDCKEIQPVHPKGDQSWIFIGRTDAEAEAPILWPPDAKNWLVWKDPDAGRVWRWEEKGTTEEEMIGWHHRLNRHEFVLGIDDGQGSLVCCSPWGHKVLNTTEQLNWTELSFTHKIIEFWLTDIWYIQKFIFRTQKNLNHPGLPLCILKHTEAFQARPNWL